MLQAAVLLLYLSTPSTASGMAVTSAEYASVEAYEAAGRRAKDQLGGWATTVRWSCSPKSAAAEAPGAPQSR